ncbi:MAG: family 78 glycoside hydrolase catalytic domain [Eubacteriales bacterium]|nr:family 78 glycoside hydrolase catalytic domain [Eubacteriales bacterium]
MLQLIDLRTEYTKNPLGLDVDKPRFSWILQSEANNTVQSSYRIIIKELRTDGRIVWDSGLIADDQSIHVEYSGEALKPMTRYEITVQVQDNHNDCAETSGWFETGLMSYQNLQAEWITHPYADEIEACPIYGRKIKPVSKLVSARAYVTALGVYNLLINGETVSGAFLSPGWTSYHNRLQYQSYDITEQITNGGLVEIETGNGWYKGIFGFYNMPNHYGKRTAVIAMIRLVYDDGSEEIISTDEAWTCRTGFRRYSEIYNGEKIDLTYAEDDTEQVVLFEHQKDMIVGQVNEPVRITERLKASKLIVTPAGEFVLDFGQNMSGVVEAKLKLPRGTMIKIRHAEVLDKNGNFYTENLRGARAEDTFICSGGDDVFIPAFTFHGFRYIAIEGMSAEQIKPEAFTACVLHSDMEKTGSFECSFAGVNRLQKNIEWGQRGNFLDIPTDCPQRDERLGWTGDAQVFAATAAYNMNVALFFTKWLRDLKAEQTLDKGVPHVIPNILGNAEGAAAWSDAATIIPWAMYEAYGDKRILEDQYESMRDWVEYIRSKAGDSNLWQSGFQYGDWLGLDKEESADRTGATDVYLVATAYYAWSTDLVAKAAQILGKTDEYEKYIKLASEIRKAFQREYITETGRLVSETQTACVLALHFNLAGEKYAPRILKTLESNLAKHNNHLVTGFVGTPYLCHVLSDNDLHELSGQVFLKQDYPSWLFAVNMGATTIWERWNSMMADGSIDESGMNSFNHYAYGSIGEWMYRKLGGLNIVEPGYKKSLIAPMPVKGITSASACLKTMYGNLSCSWKCQDGMFYIDVEVPVNTEALIKLPEQEEEISVGSGKYHYEYVTTMQLEFERYSLENTLGEIMSNPLAVELLKQYAPDISDNPMIEFAYNMTIVSLTSNMPEGGADLFKMVIAKLNEAEKTKA